MSANTVNNRYWLLLCLISAVLCFPVLFVTYAPLVDYPNHLARAYILYHYQDVPVFQLAYDRVLEPIPNLAIDLVVPFLLQFFDILTASKIFLTITVLLFVAGCHMLGRAIHERPAWLALPCSFFVYSSMLLYGFINYVFGVGLFCVTLACWLKWREHWTAARFLLVVALTFCAYLAHLSAYCFLGVAFVIVTVWDYCIGKNALRAAVLGLAPLLLPFIAFVVFMRGSGQTGHIIWNTVSGKLIAALSPILSYDYALDAILLLGLLLIAAVCARRVRRVQVVWPLFIAGVIFALLYLLSPKVLFTSSAADARFVLPAALLCVLSLKIDLPEATGKVLLSVCLLACVVRIGSIWRTWSVADKRIAAEVDQLAVLPKGATVYPMFTPAGNNRIGKVERSFEHIVQYATINSHAFVPTLFAIKGQQPLLFHTPPRYAAVSDSDPEQWLRDIADYDYVWSYDADETLEKNLRDRCTPVTSADGFTLWRVN